jgi:hypothetical protein
MALADKRYEATSGDEGRRLLKLYEEKKPHREGVAEDRSSPGQTRR